MAQVRAHMPNSRRAKQFSMFDALKGLKEALAAAEKTPEPRRYLSDTAIEELNHQISVLQKGQIITVIYYRNRRNQIFLLTNTPAAAAKSSYRPNIEYEQMTFDLYHRRK